MHSINLIFLRNNLLKIVDQTLTGPIHPEGLEPESGEPSQTIYWIKVSRVIKSNWTNIHDKHVKDQQAMSSLYIFQIRRNWEHLWIIILVQQRAKGDTTLLSVLVSTIFEENVMIFQNN